METPTAAGPAGGQPARTLSPLSVWALSFGSAVGWGAFVLPGTTFLPTAGPAGTAIGILIGAAVLFLIGMNYHYLMNRFPGNGGALAYVTEAFGPDHGFLAAWFLALVYVAIVWANASAVVLIARNLLGGVFQFGFHYQLFGYEIYLGEALVSVAAILAVGLVVMAGRRLAPWLQVAMAILLFGGVAACFLAVMGNRPAAALAPAFAPGGGAPRQVAGIVALAPWAFVGFESVSQSTAEFRFPVKRALRVLAAALLTSALSYILLSLMAAGRSPQGYAGWPDYLGDLENQSGLQGLPAFFAAESALGQAGVWILGAAALCAILTGLLGNLFAAGRLLSAMSGYGILPRWFGKLNRGGAPQNALLAILLISLPIPFLGRTAIGWIVDVNTVCAAIAYGYISGAAARLARREGRGAQRWVGLAGLAASIGFFFYFMSSAVQSMPAESYLILAAWSVLGFVFFRFVFSRDTDRRFGKTIIVWVGLLFLIFFTSLMWVRRVTGDMTQRVAENVAAYYEAQAGGAAGASEEAAQAFLAGQISQANGLLVRNSVIQMAITVMALAIMFSVYNTIAKRERLAETQRVRAEESSKAKSTFLFNMSHDIRTPMNAITGYTALAKKLPGLPPQAEDYLTKIDASSQHLLTLIDDILEMGRVESAKMELRPEYMDLPAALGEVRDLFAAQMAEKDIGFTLDTSQVRDRVVLCDKHRLDRVLMNLLSNAYKFTPAGGNVSVSLYQIDTDLEGRGAYELRVKDSGIGMSKEFAAKVFETFERERTSTVSGIQGTGLGMAITKSIVDLMGGSIEVISAPGQGTEFIVRLAFPLRPEGSAEGGAAPGSAGKAPDLKGKRLLLVEDNEINREIALLLLEEAGFVLDTAADGREAVEKVAAAPPDFYDAVLMDIQMPVMNGYEAARAIRALDDPTLAGVPIIAMTANAFQEDIQAALDAGMNGHIAKPIDVQKMLNTIAAALG